MVGILSLPGNYCAIRIYKHPLQFYWHTRHKILEELSNLHNLLNFR